MTNCRILPTNITLADWAITAKSNTMMPLWLAKAVVGIRLLSHGGGTISHDDGQQRPANRTAHGQLNDSEDLCVTQTIDQNPSHDPTVRRQPCVES